MKIQYKNAAYISEVTENILKDIIMIGLYKNESYMKLNSIMIPFNKIQKFISSYPTLEEYLRARYRIIFNLLSDCSSKIKIDNPHNDIDHVFFIKD